VIPGPEGPCSGVDCFDDDNEFSEIDGEGDGDGDGDNVPGDLGGVNRTYWFPVTRP